MDPSILFPFSPWIFVGIPLFMRFLALWLVVAPFSNGIYCTYIHIKPKGKIGFKGNHLQLHCKERGLYQFYIKDPKRRRKGGGTFLAGQNCTNLYGGDGGGWACTLVRQSATVDDSYKFYRKSSWHVRD
jgi:hypothetical protein